MSVVHSDRWISLTGMPFPAQMQWDGQVCMVEADVPEAELAAAVAAAPDRPSVDAARVMRRERAARRFLGMADRDPASWTDSERQALARAVGLLVRYADVDWD